MHDGVTVNTPPVLAVCCADDAREPPRWRHRRCLVKVQLSPATLNDVLITHKLRTRRRRKANLYQENEALRALARTMASEPEKLIDSLLETALELCCAGSAGLSLSETLPDGKRVFRWVNLAGQFKPYVGGTTPADFSPCGVTVEREAPQLFAYPEHYFQYLG